MADVFISFRTDDTPRVQAVHDAFRARGLSVFWSNDIPKGAPNYQAIIKDEILKAPVVVVVWTNASVHSGPVIQESSQAERANKLFQILLDEIEPIDMPMEVRYKSQKTLLLGWRGDLQHPDWRKLNAAIDDRLGKGSASTQLTPPAMSDCAVFLEKPSAPYVHLGPNMHGGYLSISPFFSPTTSHSIHLENPCVLLMGDTLTSIGFMRPTLDLIQRTGQALLVLVGDVEGQALSDLVTIKLDVGLKLGVSKAPAFADRRQAYLEDIAAFTGGQVIADTTNNAPANLLLGSLGRAKTTILDRENTLIVDGAGGWAARRHRFEEAVKSVMETTSDYDREKTCERILVFASSLDEAFTREQYKVIENTEVWGFEGSNRRYVLKTLRRLK